MGRFNRDSRKIVLDSFHPIRVSKAIWPIKTRINTHINTHMPYHKDAQQNRQYTFPHAEFMVRSSSQHAAFKQISARNNQLKRVPRIYIMQPFRVTFSLLIAGLALAFCILYSWTTLLILSLVCAAITLIMIHLLFDEETDATSSETSDNPRQQYNMQNTAYLLSPKAMEQTPIAPIPSSSPSPISASPTNSQPLDEIPPAQPVHHSAGDTPTFPTTPMPTTPIVRVLETIDLSSTNVAHFLDIHDEWHEMQNMQNIPLSQLPVEAPLTEQEKSPIERQEED